jgi:hypothetical protein
MPMKRGYIGSQDYRAAKTIDDYIMEVGWDTLAGEYDRAKETLIWLMTVMIKDKETESGRTKESISTPVKEEFVSSEEGPSGGQGEVLFASGTGEFWRRRCG